MSTAGKNVIIRELESMAEFQHAVQLQRQVWGDADPPDNVDIMLAIQREGGLVAGAFESERMLGFLFAFPTREPAVQHSHRLAVHPESRGLGLGARLKWFQREWCLARDITLVRWTYDPLRSVNAALNIERLGATAGIYHENYYGDMEGINAGVPSDRIVAEWRVGTPAVALRAGHSSGVQAGLAKERLQVAIPADFGTLLVKDPTRAMAERLRVREALQAAFASGFRVVGFDRGTCQYALIS